MKKIASSTFSNETIETIMKELEGDEEYEKYEE